MQMVVENNSGRIVAATETKEQMEARIRVLSDEIDANEEENRMMLWEIQDLYERIDAMN